jgi:hypothetical protein
MTPLLTRLWGLLQKAPPAPGFLVCTTCGVPFDDGAGSLGVGAAQPVCDLQMNLGDNDSHQLSLSLSLSLSPLSPLLPAQAVAELFYQRHHVLWQFVAREHGEKNRERQVVDAQPAPSPARQRVQRALRPSDGGEPVACVTPPGVRESERWRDGLLASSGLALARVASSDTASASRTARRMIG